MADAETLSQAFMRAHPAEAARVLEVLAPAEAAALLARVPARLAAPVFAAMLPNAAARALGGLEDEQALALLGDLGTQPLVAVLRHVAEPRRSRLTAGLPTAAALASKLLLGYVEDAVGAWTDPDVLALPGATHAADALERVRHAEATVQRVFVTAAGGRLEGWVPLRALLRAPATASLASIMTRPEAVLSAQTPLAGAAAHPGWERTSALPVLEAGERLVGVLTRDALTRALGRTARPLRGAAENTLAGMLARGYWDALSGGAEAMATLLPAVGPVAGKRDEH
jgi:Mg/Co/Ni transporter MgtE